MNMWILHKNLQKIMPRVCSENFEFRSHFLEFQDATREGDGERIIHRLRYLLLIFKESGRTNFSTEAFILLAQYQHYLAKNADADYMVSYSQSTCGQDAIFHAIYSVNT